ncbi:hypothetical protein [Bradyrhizobium erythrophlei]|jgi:hypothetical protein|uniref:Secreted protein n=1 Tax=Bradyrhizobium erythrophlei TaxID=1437360 RepID=A0A1M7TXP7_9BRAD|nr:hypothetical protein [Bradyrhizobium erythrophlei]SHN75481.1 hypothetical protein SAMN05444170_2969 [Bradyrhizobium erythrophlei]
MTKLLALLATLKTILIAASVAFARGDTCAVVVVSALLSLVQLGAKPAGHVMLENAPVVSSSSKVEAFPKTPGA